MEWWPSTTQAPTPHQSHRHVRPGDVRATDEEGPRTEEHTAAALTAAAIGFHQREDKPLRCGFTSIASPNRSMSAVPAFSTAAQPDG